VILKGILGEGYCTVKKPGEICRLIAVTQPLRNLCGMACKYFRCYNPVLDYHNKHPFALVSPSLETLNYEMECVLSSGLRKEMCFHTEFARGVLCNKA